METCETVTSSEGSAPAPPANSEPRPAYLIPVLTFWQEAVLRLIAFAWIITGLSFWMWWLDPRQLGFNIAAALVTGCLAWLFVLGGYFLFFACGMRRPNPAVALPKLRVAMAVTMAPSEPWPVLQRTLRGMLAQDFPYPFDVWLVTEKRSRKASRWCRQHGVQVASRSGVAEYHRAEWPRRTRCKEGNLAYFYDTYGYARYDVVAQLDADHVPSRHYLEHMVRPFADPAVGYVAAPSICDANAGDGWTVRGRLHKEATMHGPLQAGSNGGWAPACIGSHYAVRTQALKEVGGLGPDLAEDFSTTLWLQAGGWEGVFAVDAEAHGDGPVTLEAMLTQEYQWARSLGTILTRWMPGKVGRLRPKARARLVFALLYYFINGVAILTATALPAIGVLTDSSWHSGTLGGWYLHLWPCSVTLLLASLWLRRCRALRPERAKLWSLEVALFQLIRWPWTTWAFVRGMWEGFHRRPPTTSFKVTPKGDTGAAPLRPALLAPTLLLAAALTACAVLAPHPARSLGLFLLASAQAQLYLLITVSVVVLHILRNRRQAKASKGRASRSKRRRTAARYRLTWAGGGAAALTTGLVAAALIGTLAVRISMLNLRWS